MSAFPFDPRTKLSPEIEATLTVRFKTQPALPSGRPPTKKETWERVHHVYHDLIPKEDLIDYARCRWAWDYAAWVNFRAWDKHPDWVEGDDVIAAAVPERPMNGNMAPVIVEQLWQQVRRIAKAKR
jgi:hypothetical protein